MLARADAALPLEAPAARTKLLLQLALIPWLLATLAVAPFSWPFQNRFGLLYEFTSGVFTIAAYRLARRASPPLVVHGRQNTTVWPWAIATFVVLFASRLTIGRPQ